MARLNLTRQGHFSEVTNSESRASKSDETTGSNSNILVSLSYQFGMVYHNNSKLWRSHQVVITQHGITIRCFVSRGSVFLLLVHPT